MRAYTVGVASLALEVDAKWLDNLLSHHTVRGVERKRQGIQRRIPPESLLLIAVAKVIIESLYAPISRALEIAEVLVASPAGRADLPASVSITCDVRAVAARLHDALGDAVDGAGIPRRGRPRN